MKEIQNAELTEKDIPSPSADWSAIGWFALTFDGYEYWGSFDKCGEVANKWASVWREKQGLPHTLTELRTCLFFEQRRWRHYGYNPDEKAMIYICALVEAIREKVQKDER